VAWIAIAWKTLARGELEHPPSKPRPFPGGRLEGGPSARVDGGSHLPPGPVENPIQEGVHALPPCGGTAHGLGPGPGPWRESWIRSR